MREERETDRARWASSATERTDSKGVRESDKKREERETGRGRSVSSGRGRGRRQVSSGSYLIAE